MYIFDKSLQLICAMSAFVCAATLALKAIATLAASTPHCFVHDQIASLLLVSDIPAHQHHNGQSTRIFICDHGGQVRNFVYGEPLAEDQPDAKRKRGRPKKDTATARIKIGEENGQAIYAEFHSPNVADRERVAMFLAKLIARNGNKSKEQSEDDEFALLCAKWAAQHAEEQKLNAYPTSLLHSALWITPSVSFSSSDLYPRDAANGLRRQMAKLSAPAKVTHER
jgi:hypothetical protein